MKIVTKCRESDKAFYKRLKINEAELKEAAHLREKLKSAIREEDEDKEKEILGRIMDL